MRYFKNPYVATSQFSPEFDNLIALYCKLKPMTVLEIGTQHGGTLWHWLHQAPDGAKVMNIDPLLTNADFLGMDLLRIWKSWARNGVEFKTIVGLSQDEGVAKEAIEWLGTIDFLFIDGDHTYRGVRRDWDLYSGHAKVITLHDLIKHQPHFGVTKLFDEIKADGYRTEEFYSQANQKGGGIGVIYNE